MSIYSFQQPAIDFAVTHLLRGSGSKLMVSPTGSGKTFMQCEVLRRVPELVQLVPTLEIACQFAHRLGSETIFTSSEAQQRLITEKLRIYTYQRFYNLLSDGRIELPSLLQYDEAHHTVSNRESTTYEYTARVPRVGWTATAYRGTPQETKKLLDDWGNETITVISLKEAVRRGVISQPVWNVWPLIDDDLIDISSGEFKVSSVEKIVGDQLEDLVMRIKQNHCPEGIFDRPSMIALTTESLCVRFAELCRHHGVPASVVVSGTDGRQKIFSEVVDRRTLLVQIRVVGEGIDLPIRRLYDGAPTMSPVLWQQRVGRLTRPTDDPPEYIGLCQNLSRHGYLWHGVMPPTAILRSQQAFGKVSKRDIIRGIGFLEGFGRFAPAPVPLKGGYTGSFYSLQSPTGSPQIGVFIHPVFPEPVYAIRHKTDSSRGTWKRIDELPDVKGYVSTHNSPLTPPMEQWYQNLAGYYGIDTDVKVNARSFQAFPFLKDIGLRIKELPT